MLEIRPTSFDEAREIILARGGYIYASSNQNPGVDRSFLVLHKGEIAGVVPAFFIDAAACFHDKTSIVPYYFCDDGLAADVSKAICEWAGHALRQDVRSIKILTNEALLAALSSKPDFSLQDNTRLYGYFDLRRDEETLWSLIRKKYKSRIRTGERNLATRRYTGADEVDPNVIEFFSSPQVRYQYDEQRVLALLEKMKTGDAMLFACSFDSTIVGAVGIVSWQKFSERGDHFYELGAYDHSCDVPVLFCLYDALRHYQRNQLGDRIFLLHGVPPKRPEDESKLANIDYFKLGYCSDTFTRPYKVVTLV
jgi:hypothetical protein